MALLLVAEPLRNTGKYTMADVLSFRMNQKPVRTAAELAAAVTQARNAGRDQVLLYVQTPRVGGRFVAVNPRG